MPGPGLARLAGAGPGLRSLCVVSRLGRRLPAAGVRQPHRGGSAPARRSPLAASRLPYTSPLSHLLPFPPPLYSSAPSKELDFPQSCVIMMLGSQAARTHHQPRPQRRRQHRPALPPPPRPGRCSAMSNTHPPQSLASQLRPTPNSELSTPHSRRPASGHTYARFRPTPNSGLSTPHSRRPASGDAQDRPRPPRTTFAPHQTTARRPPMTGYDHLRPAIQNKGPQPHHRLPHQPARLHPRSLGRESLLDPLRQTESGFSAQRMMPGRCLDRTMRRRVQKRVDGSEV